MWCSLSDGLRSLKSSGHSSKYRLNFSSQHHLPPSSNPPYHTLP
ncbi:Protein of unknown function [Pyronema omphalodes CBS 100304]|uniref:Uncharacterized protein n=1 Tax=Pyronema omphalodes (strain CBS 100304) TaxID=1076935 RepID=U4LK29_PYROM|nr:Protein of unknown function [Pyronema omphalodes CBS 100304]